MSGRFVRASKYRHVFGRSTKKEQCYDNLRLSKNAWDSNIIKVNPKYLSANYEAGGGGAFAVIPLDERGKLPDIIPLFRGHTGPVLDTDWNPFNDNVIASGSDDGKVFIWQVPENFSLHSDAEEPQDVAPAARLAGHTRKVGHVIWNPSAENVLASSSGDYLVKFWDVEHGQTKLTLKHPDMVQSLSFSANGSLLVTTCRDKKLRIWDVRSEKPVHEGLGHGGAKNSRAVWMGEHDRIATTGFSKMSDRQLGLWDMRAAREPLNGFEILDSISGVCMPFWDDGTQILYLAGKGDGNIRYFEYEHDKFEFLSEYKSVDPQRGVAFMPKRGVNLHENEVALAYKTVNDNYIEPIPFIVPRRAEVFQEDIYPPTTGLKPGMSAAEFWEGKDAVPPKFSLEATYEGTAPVEVPSDYKPTPAPAPAPKAEPKSEPKAEPSPAPAARGPPASVNDNKASMADMAAKFVDKDEPEESADEESSFEEIPKPVERPSATAARQEEKTRGPEISKAPEPEVVSERAAKAESEPVKETPRSVSTSSTAASSAAAGIKDYLSDIKSMLENQNTQLASQLEQITHLTSEVNLLKTKVADLTSTEKDEKIRQLELELEEARS
ncbi:actin-binding protein-like protein [Macrophomina phaseolina]|uniref:Coronin n=1 Tax=Macrophomina phaseolina TaxID=35725 RepID=A0ABQ8GQX4_9PEZI|nr:actin-binding protein-like protein [Macrophomina phaseolina]